MFIVAPPPLLHICPSSFPFLNLLVCFFPFIPPSSVIARPAPSTAMPPLSFCQQDLFFLPAHPFLPGLQLPGRHIKTPGQPTPYHIPWPVDAAPQECRSGPRKVPPPFHIQSPRAVCRLRPLLLLVIESSPAPFPSTQCPIFLLFLAPSHATSPLCFLCGGICSLPPSPNTHTPQRADVRSVRFAKEQPEMQVFGCQSDASGACVLILDKFPKVCNSPHAHGTCATNATLTRLQPSLVSVPFFALQNRNSFQRSLPRAPPPPALFC